MAKPQPFLNYMPWHVKQKIADEVDAGTKPSLRLCSKEYKEYVDSAKTIFSTLEFKWMRNSRGKQSFNIHLQTSGRRGPQLQFFPKDAGYRKRNDARNWEKVVREEGDYIEGALLQLMKIVKNPKCVVENFELEVPNADMVKSRTAVRRINETKREFLRRLDEHLNRLNHRLKVNKLQITFDGRQFDLEQVLRHLEPGTLKEIIIFRPGCLFFGYPQRLVLDRIAETEQWKQAERLYMDFYEIGLPLSKWSHFRSTTVRFQSICLEELQEIIDAVAQSPKWERCSVICRSYNRLQFRQYFQRFPFYNNTQRRLLASNSEQDLHINCCTVRISIIKSSVYEDE